MALPALAAAMLSACQVSEPEPAETVENLVENAAPPRVPLPDPPMTRADLLAAVAAAASVRAAGGDDSEAQRALDGRRFEIRIRFGCRGPSTDLQQAVLGWSLDPEKRTLRVKATPTVSIEDPMVATIVGEDVEAVEGFWIPRPWLMEPVCPGGAPVRDTPATEESESEPSAPQAGAPERARLAERAQAEGPDLQETQSPPPAYPKVGIAQFFTSSDPRTRRRAMRPYEIAKVVESGTPIGSRGYNLVLSGRLSALSTGGVIHCIARGPNAPPDCIISASIDQVRLERPETREMLAEWGTG